jgi:hypothetical protein
VFSQEQHAAEGDVDAAKSWGLLDAQVLFNSECWGELMVLPLKQALAFNLPAAAFNDAWHFKGWVSDHMQLCLHQQ